MSDLNKGLELIKSLLENGCSESQLEQILALKNAFEEGVPILI